MKPRIQHETTHTTTQRLAEVDGKLAIATDQLDVLLQSKLDLLEALGGAEQHQTALMHRLDLMEQEHVAKCDVIAGLKVALYTVVQDDAEAIDDPNVAACFSASS